MGIETAVIAGLALTSAIGQYNQSKSEARQAVHTGAIAAQNRADEIKQLASRQRVSYLQAGLELEGTPQTVINDTYNIGVSDVKSIIGSYNQKSKNILTVARGQLLSNVLKTGISAYTMPTGVENMGQTQTLTENGSIIGNIPVQPRKPLFTGVS